MSTKDPAGFGDANPELVSFVRHRDTVHLPPEYDVYLTLVRSGRSVQEEVRRAVSRLRPAMGDGGKDA